MKKTKEEARIRNWNKLRVSGFNLNTKGLTDKEYDQYSSIMHDIEELRKNWDEQSEIYLGHPLKTFKCVSCGKRSNVEHLIENHNYCFFHYKTFTDENI